MCEHDEHGCGRCHCGIIPPSHRRPGTLLRAEERRWRLACLFGIGLAISLPLACSRTLTPVQATAARAMVGPNCAQLGSEAAQIPVFIVSEVTGALIAILCPTIENDIISAETIVTVDGGVGATAPALAFTEGCVPVPVAGDPLGQWACPELAARVRDASAKRMAKGARK